MRPLYVLLATATVALTAVAGAVGLLRWDTALRQDGSSVSRDRLTGDVLICSSANVCQRRSSTEFVPKIDWRDPSFKDVLDEVGRTIDTERQAAADLSRSQKGGPRKLLDVGLSLGAGLGELGIDAFDWLFGPPTYKPGEQWTRIWNTRNEVWQSIDILKRESVSNRIASFVGYYLGLIAGLGWIGFALRKPALKRLQKFSDRVAFRKGGISTS
jgi:hypothetical protein